MFRSLFPSPLPTGMQEFDLFCDSIFATYDLPNNPSYRQAIATMIMHLSPTTFYKPKLFFAISVKKAMSNQIAYENIQILKQQEKEKQEATQKAESAESHELQIQGV